MFQRSQIKTVLFRADSSSVIGVGHVMRCLTLAQALQQAGAQCHFACRDLPGHQSGLVLAQGFGVHILQGNSPEEVHQLCCDLAAGWLVVDHYGLDGTWENAASPDACLVAVIDDLANRTHDCDLLLDQNLGVKHDAYAELVPPDARILIGPHYALLRPDFAQARARSLQRRAEAQGLDLFVNFGGADPCSATSRVLDCLAGQMQNFDRLTVVLGGAILDPAPLRMQAGALGATVITNTPDMAQIMAQADLAIGAAGSTAWERCCLGLPTGMIIVADNQRAAAIALEQNGAARILGDLTASDDISAVGDFVTQCRADRATLARMSDCAASIIDGQGAARVTSVMKEIMGE